MFKKKSMIFIFLLALCVGSVYIVAQHSKFGKVPSGERLERIKKSLYYKNGRFENVEYTPQFAEDTSMPAVMMRILFGKKENTRPAKPLHFTKTDLHSLDINENVYVWMGHSSYFLQLDGKRILVDPVFSGNASPFKFTTKAFEGTDLYTAADIPALDYLIITHDHWDHLDYETVTQLREKVKQVITGLGTGAHLEHWKYNPTSIIELDWEESFDLGGGFSVHAETTRHFSGRGLKRNKAIWSSFVLHTPQKRIYIGGDSGYGAHFKKIGNKYGGFDLAILENGQYNYDWKYIHLMPEEFLMAAKELKSQRVIAVHNSKFALAPHGWKEPMQRLTELNKKEKLRIISPKICEIVDWQDDSQTYEPWWGAAE